MLRARRECRESKRKARDIEMAEAADKADRVAVQEYKKMMAEKKARDMIEAVEKGNDLVGSKYSASTAAACGFQRGVATAAQGVRRGALGRADKAAVCERR